MRRLFGKFTFVPVILIIVGFVWFTARIAQPQKSVERESLVTGTIHPANPLRPDGPFIPYVALHKGKPDLNAIPEVPLDDRQPDGDGAFELSADPGDGRVFWLLARFETAKQETYCNGLALPRMRKTEDGAWVEAATGKPLAPVRIAVDKSERC
jgi:hypothetical protein